MPQRECLAPASRAGRWRLFRFSRGVIAGVVLATRHKQMRGRGQVAQVSKQPAKGFDGIGRELPGADFRGGMHQ